MKKVKVLVADGEELSRKGVCSLLSGYREIDISGEAATGEETIEAAWKTSPDVVLMDSGINDEDGADITVRIKKDNSDVKVLFLTRYQDRERIVKGLKAGASGYITRKASPAELVSAIMTVHKGGHYLLPETTRAIVEDYMRSREEMRAFDSYRKLTAREKSILNLIVEGYKSREIADLLNISLSTVLGHRANLMKKLGVHSATRLVRYAVSNYWISQERKSNGEQATEKNKS